MNTENAARAGTNTNDELSNGNRMASAMLTIIGVIFDIITDFLTNQGTTILIASLVAAAVWRIARHDRAELLKGTIERNDGREDARVRDLTARMEEMRTEFLAELAAASTTLEESDERWAKRLADVEAKTAERLESQSARTMTTPPRTSPAHSTRRTLADSEESKEEPISPTQRWMTEELNEGPYVGISRTRPTALQASTSAPSSASYADLHPHGVRARKSSTQEARDLATNVPPTPVSSSSGRRRRMMLSQLANHTDYRYSLYSRSPPPNSPPPRSGMEGQGEEGGGDISTVNAAHMARSMNSLSEGLRQQNRNDGQYLIKLTNAEDEKRRKTNLVDFKDTIGKLVSQDEVNMTSILRCFDMAPGIEIGSELQMTDLFNALMEAAKMDRANPHNPLRYFRGKIDARLASLATRGRLLGAQGGTAVIGTGAFAILDDDSLRSVHRLSQAQLETKASSAGKNATTSPGTPEGWRTCMGQMVIFARVLYGDPLASWLQAAAIYGYGENEKDPATATVAILEEALGEAFDDLLGHLRRVVAGALSDKPGSTPNNVDITSLTAIFFTHFGINVDEDEDQDPIEQAIMHLYDAAPSFENTLRNKLATYEKIALRQVVRAEIKSSTDAKRAKAQGAPARTGGEEREPLDKAIERASGIVKLTKKEKQLFASRRRVTTVGDKSTPYCLCCWTLGKGRCIYLNNGELVHADRPRRAKTELIQRLFCLRFGGASEETPLPSRRWPPNVDDISEDSERLANEAAKLRKSLATSQRKNEPSTGSDNISSASSALLAEEYPSPKNGLPFHPKEGEDLQNLIEGMNDAPEWMRNQISSANCPEWNHLHVTPEGRFRMILAARTEEILARKNAKHDGMENATVVLLNNHAHAQLMTMAKRENWTIDDVTLPLTKETKALTEEAARVGMKQLMRDARTLGSTRLLRDLDTSEGLREWLRDDSEELRTGGLAWNQAAGRGAAVVSKGESTYDRDLAAGVSDCRLGMVAGKLLNLGENIMHQGEIYSKRCLFLAMTVGVQRLQEHVSKHPKTTVERLMSFSESAHDDFMAQATKANQTVEVAHDGMTLTLKEVREGIHDVLHSGHSMRASVLAMFPTVNRDCVIFIVYTDDDGNVTHTREIVGDEASDPERQVTLICSDGHAQLFQPDDPLSTEDVEALVEKMLEADPSIDHEVIRASGYEPALDRARVSAAEPIVNVDKTPCPVCLGRMTHEPRCGHCPPSMLLSLGLPALRVDRSTLAFHAPTKSPELKLSPTPNWEVSRDAPWVTVTDPLTGAARENDKPVSYVPAHEEALRLDFAQDLETLVTGLERAGGSVSERSPRSGGLEIVDEETAAVDLLLRIVRLAPKDYSDDWRDVITLGCGNLLVACGNLERMTKLYRARFDQERGCNVDLERVALLRGKIDQHLVDNLEHVAQHGFSARNTTTKMNRRVKSYPSSELNKKFMPRQYELARSGRAFFFDADLLAELGVAVVSSPTASRPKTHADGRLTGEFRTILDLSYASEVDGVTVCVNGGTSKYAHPIVALPRLQDPVRRVIWMRLKYPGLDISLCKKDASEAYERLMTSPCDVHLFATDKDIARDVPPSLDGVTLDENVNQFVNDYKSRLKACFTLVVVFLAGTFGYIGLPGIYHACGTTPIEQHHQHYRPALPTWHGDESFDSHTFVDDGALSCIDALVLCGLMASCYLTGMFLTLGPNALNMKKDATEGVWDWQCIWWGTTVSTRSPTGQRRLEDITISCPAARCARAYRKLSSPTLDPEKRSELTIREVASVAGTVRFMTDVSRTAMVAFTSLNMMLRRRAPGQRRVNPPGTHEEREWAFTMFYLMIAYLKLLVSSPPFWRSTASQKGCTRLSATERLAIRPLRGSVELIGSDSSEPLGSVVNWTRKEYAIFVWTDEVEKSMREELINNGTPTSLLTEVIISIKELIMGGLAPHLVWGLYSTGKVFLNLNDNDNTVSWLNKRVASNPFVQNYLLALGMLEVTRDNDTEAIWIWTHRNKLPDYLTRFSSSDRPEEDIPHVEKWMEENYSTFTRIEVTPLLNRFLKSSWSPMKPTPLTPKPCDLGDSAVPERIRGAPIGPRLALGVAVGCGPGAAQLLALLSRTRPDIVVTKLTDVDRGEPSIAELLNRRFWALDAASDHFGDGETILMVIDAINVEPNDQLRMVKEQLSDREGPKYVLALGTVADEARELLENWCGGELKQCFWPSHFGDPVARPMHTTTFSRTGERRTNPIIVPTEMIRATPAILRLIPGHRVANDVREMIALSQSFHRCLSPTTTTPSNDALRGVIVGEAAGEAVYSAQHPLPLERVLVLDEREEVLAEVQELGENETTTVVRRLTDEDLWSLTGQAHVEVALAVAAVGSNPEEMKRSCVVNEHRRMMAAMPSTRAAQEWLSTICELATHNAKGAHHRETAAVELAARARVSESSTFVRAEFDRKMWSNKTYAKNAHVIATTEESSKQTPIAEVKSTDAETPKLGSNVEPTPLLRPTVISNSRMHSARSEGTDSDQHTNDDDSSTNGMTTSIPSAPEERRQRPQLSTTRRTIPGKSGVKRVNFGAALLMFFTICTPSLGTPDDGPPRVNGAGSQRPPPTRPYVSTRFMPWDDGTEHNIRAQREKLFSSAYAPSTRKAYGYAFGQWALFLKNHCGRTNPYLFPEDHYNNERLAIDFVAYKASIGNKYATVKGALAGIAFAHKAEQLPHPFGNMGLLEHHLRGLKRLSGDSTGKLPVTIDVLQTLSERMNAGGTLVHATITAGAQLAFFALLRSSEYCVTPAGSQDSFDPDRTLLDGDIMTMSNSNAVDWNVCSDDELEGVDEVVISIKSSKTDQGRVGVTRTVERTGVRGACPVTSTIHFIRQRRSAGLLFDDGRPFLRWGRGHLQALRRAIVGRELKATMCDMNLDHAETDTHSLRQGGATTLIANGVDPDVVRRFGRWLSDAFLRYTFNTSMHTSGLSKGMARTTYTLEQSSADFLATRRNMAKRDLTRSTSPNAEAKQRLHKEKETTMGDIPAVSETADENEMMNRQWYDPEDKKTFAVRKFETVMYEGTLYRAAFYSTVGETNSKLEWSKKSEVVEWLDTLPEHGPQNTQADATDHNGGD